MALPSLNQQHVESFSVFQLSPPLLLLGADESSLLLRTYLIIFDLKSWGSFLEFLPTTKIQLKCHHLQKILDVHSCTSFSSSFLPPCLYKFPFFTSTTSHSKSKHQYTITHSLLAYHSRRIVKSATSVFTPVPSNIIDAHLLNAC